MKGSTGMKMILTDRDLELGSSVTDLEFGFKRLVDGGLFVHMN